ncbi:MAG TPA: TonB-dependent receptor [Longimicrobiales bacterium]|nr:TonB-dependent receptor [Longimicrobiales bacterium]
MRVQRSSAGPLLGLAAVLAVALAAPVAAQQGLLTGRITDVATGLPIEAAQVQILGGARSTGGLTDGNGTYHIQLAAGTYSVVVEYVGYRSERFPGIRVLAGQPTVYDIRLTSRALELDPIVVSPSRSGVGEKETKAPASVHTISSLEISERAVTTPVDYIKNAPGVDVISSGLQSSNVVVRGFNNIFSGALHMLTDNRIAGVPSLRVNLIHFVPSNEQDIERMEVVLGPGSALYGPNTANGVVHILTKSPLDDQGTTVTLGGGERSVFQGNFRSAFLLNPNLGFKVSALYLRGNEWPFEDSTEVANRKWADANPQACLADRVFRGLSAADAQLSCGRIGIRHYKTKRFGLEARADWRFAEKGTFIATYGRTDATGIEMTGLGAGQTGNWVYQFFQGRVRYDRFFAQAYVNQSDAGDTYLLNSGMPLVDKSSLWVAQAQHGFALADGRQDFTYGFDFLGTRPSTEGKINGSYEDMDNVNEWGIYLQSKTALTDQLDLIFAGRLDDHSILADKVLSPRAALVFKPTEEQSFRLSFNRAYSAPSTLNYFLDIPNGYAPGLAALGYGLRAYGTGANGWSVANADGSPKGFRSPFNPAGPSTLVPMAGTTAFWKAATGVVAAQTQDPAARALLAYLGTLTPAPGSIGTMLYNPQSKTLSALAQTPIQGLPSVRESNAESFEVGWTGIVAQRIKLTADLYRTTQNDFVSPLLIQNPLVMFNGQDVGKFLTAPVVGALTQQYMAAGLTLAQAQAKAAQDAPAIVGQLAAGIAQVPIGVVSSSDLPGGADLLVSYRNVGNLTLWGADLAFEWFVTDNWILNGSYSHVSDDMFDIDDGDPIALNAPTHKGALSVAYRNVRNGFNGEARVRLNNAFPAVSAGFNGGVPSSETVDLNLGYKVPRTNGTVQLTVSNLFDTEYKSFVGVPTIGRMALIRVKYDLF